VWFLAIYVLLLALLPRSTGSPTGSGPLRLMLVFAVPALMVDVVAARGGLRLLRRAVMGVGQLPAVVGAGRRWQGRWWPDPRSGRCDGSAPAWRLGALALLVS
jgi:hypothetical protein